MAGDRRQPLRQHHKLGSEFGQGWVGLQLDRFAIALLPIAMPVALRVSHDYVLQGPTLRVRIADGHHVLPAPRPRPRRRVTAAPRAVKPADQPLHGQALQELARVPAVRKRRALGPHRHADPGELRADAELMHDALDRGHELSRALFHPTASGHRHDGHVPQARRDPQEVFHGSCVVRQRLLLLLGALGVGRVVRRGAQGVVPI
mmetsp:Transcript_31700/g.62890  ORF Transcript_31700/g.62890 Transcript_31700/m.62890 type:complete len:204 (-) Transcript_31700:20-631(-)